MPDGNITIKIVGDKAQFDVVMNDAKRKASDTATDIKKSFGGVTKAFGDTGKAAESFGHSTVSGTQAASASIRLLEGRFGSMVRAAEQFIGRMPAVSNALKLAFPAIGAIAIAGVFVELGKRAADFADQLDKVKNRPKAIADAFRDVTIGMAASNAELQVTNDRLAIAIAHLNHKPGNELKLALDEATASAFKLAQTLSKDMEEVTKLLKANETGPLDFALGKADNKTVTGESKVFQDNMAAMLLKQADAMSKVTTEDQKNALAKQQLADRQKAYTAEIARNNAELAKARSIQPVTGFDAAGRTITYASVNPRDTAALAASRTAYGTSLGQQSALDRLQNTNNSLTSQEQGAQQAKSPFPDIIKRLQSELTGQQQESTASQFGGQIEAASKAYAKAQEVIEGANKTLEESGRSLSKEQEGEILTIERKIEFSKELARQQAVLTKAQEELRAAFLKVNEAVQVSTDNAASEAAKKAVEGQKTIADLQKQYDAAGLGADARKRAQFAPTGTPLDYLDTAGQQKRAEEEAKYNLAVKESVTSLNEETAATLRLATAADKGLGAQRSVARVNIAANPNDSDAVKAAKLKQFDTQATAQDAARGVGQSASDGLDNYFLKLHEETISAGKEVQDILGKSFESLDDQLAKMITGQKTNWHSFFTSIADDLAKIAIKNAMIGLLTGGKGASGATGKGALGGLAGILMGDGKNHGGILGTGSAPDSSDPSGTAPILGGPSGKSGTGGIGGFFKGILGAAFGIKMPKGGANGSGAGGDALNADDFDYGNEDTSALGDDLDFGGGLAVGGDVDPGTTYMVGEKGPEMFSSAVAGSITPNDKLGGSSGGGTTNIIDARGADPVSTAQRTNAAIIQSNKQSVRQSFQSVKEYDRRTPK